MSPQDQDANLIEASVIVVTHNNESLIAHCLRSIDGAVRVNAYETIVVDNASSDGTISAIPDDTSARVIPLDANVGFAAAANAGIEASRGSLIVLVNSDAFPDPGSIDGLIDAIKELPQAGIVGGRLRYPDGRLQPSVGRFPSLPGNLWVALFLHRLPLAGRSGIGISAHPALYRSRRAVDWVTAAFCIARREAAALPSHWFMYGEDVAWAFASRQAGFEVWFDPRASAVHIGRASVDQSQGPGFAQRRRVQFELEWFRRRGRIWQIAARAVIAVHAVARLAIFGIGGAVRGRSDSKVSENVALLRAAFSTRPTDGSDADRIAAKSDPLGC
jgi:GT2 family glycosyltransferase